MTDQQRGFHYADVVAVEQLTVHMVRVTFGGEHVAGYRTLGAPDECVGVYFPREGESAPPPMTEVDGLWWFHGLENAPEGIEPFAVWEKRLQDTVAVRAAGWAAAPRLLA